MLATDLHHPPASARLIALEKEFEEITAER
jgi:hypothetical protein